MRIFWLFLWIPLSLCVNAQSLVINEVAYSNKTVLVDAYGDSPDWFELYNAGTEVVNLLGYAITDDTSKTEYWHFPSCELAPGAFLLVYASDKDTVTQTEWHTSFKLGNMKESLFLIGPSGAIADLIYPTCVPTDCSLARQPDGSPNLVVTSPTPAQSNNDAPQISINYIRDTLRVDLNSGFYSSPVTLNLSNDHSGNTIMYTLNGNDPDEDSEVYTGSLSLDDLTSQKNRFANIPRTDVEPGNLIFKGNILRAVVYSSGCPASNEITNAYYINKALKNHYQVPVVSLITDKDNLFDDDIGIYVKGDHVNYEQHGKDWEREVHVEIFDTTGVMVLDQDAGMRIHGRGTRRSPQKSIRLYADEDYGKTSFEYPFFSQKPGIDSFRVLLLRTTGGTLGTLIRDQVCNYLVEDMNIDYAASETVVLFINGEYWGIYNLMERHNEYYVENNYNISLDSLDIIAYDWGIVVEEGSDEAYQELVTWARQADPEQPEFYDALDDRIDVDAMIDYYVAELYFANYDWPYSNFEMWKTYTDTARWRYFFFDSDATMIWFDYDHLSEYNNSISEFQRFDEFSTFLLKTVLRNDTFRERFMTRFYTHMATTFSTDQVLATIEKFEKKYEPLVPEQVYRWGNPTDFPIWKRNVSAMKNFAVQRPLFITGQLQRNFGNPVIVYPNPGDGRVFVDFKQPANAVTIKAFSINGGLMRQWQFNQPGNEPKPLNTQLSPGIYLLQINMDGRLYHNKLIVQ